MGLAELQGTFSWPENKPNVPPNEEPIFFDGYAAAVLERLAPKDAKVVVEIGSWLGTSIKFFSETCPQATLISIDTWEGSPEHQTGATHDSSHLLSKLFDTFRVNTWHLKDRLIPMKTDSLTGMKLLHHFGIEPDLIYIDAAHEREAVCEDVTMANCLFPKALICGDDYCWYSVRDGMSDFVATQVRAFAYDNCTWWLI